MKTTVFYTANFAYFCFNFPSDFIKSVFGDSTLGQHLTSKFNTLCSNTDSTALAVLKFFTDLSEDNQELLLEWIENYYCFSQTRKDNIREN